MSEDNREQHRLDRYTDVAMNETVDVNERPREGNKHTETVDNQSVEITDKMSFRASEWVETLRARAIEHDWHLQQGKGRSGDSAVDQDLLSHTMDVVHITYNIIEGMNLTDDLPLDTRTVLSVAFFHDLHKRPEVGGTESMCPAEVKEVLSEWDVGETILNGIDLQELTDILRSIHQWHGNSDSRAVVNARPELLLLTNIVRLADMIASVRRLNELAGDGRYQNPFEPLETITAAAGSVDKEYTLGYHRLSTVRPALSALVHEALYREFTDRDAILLATRADGAVYAFPKSVEIATQGTSEGDSDILNAVTKRIRERVFSSEIRDAVPDKLQKQFYGLDGAVEIRVEEQRQAIQYEEVPGHDIEDDIRSVASDLDSCVDDSYGIKVSDDNEADVDIIAVNNNASIIYIEYPMTEKGEVIGEAISQVMDAIFPINEEEDLPANITSRLDVLAELADAIVTDKDSKIDTEQFKSVYWQRVSAQLSRVLGNQLESASSDATTSILDNLEQRAVELVAGDEEQPDEERDASGLRGTVRDHLAENVSINIYHNQQPASATRVNLPSDVKVGLDYDESCVLCGREASIPFRTTGGGEFKKSYLVRGEAGRDMTDADSGAWHLCDVCFLDNALFRASAGNVPSLRDIENALFLKIVPNRYLGTARVARLRQEFAEGNAFGSISNDAERHLNSEYNLSAGETLPFNMVDAGSSTLAEEYTVDLSGPIVDESGIIIGSPHYFVVAVEDGDDRPTNQETKTWLRALFRALVLSRYHNFSVVIGGRPTMLADEYQLVYSGVRLNNPPSQIRSVFGDRIPYYETDLHLTGLSALIYAEDNFPQYQSDGSDSFGPDQLTRAYDSFRGSVLPGAQMYRAGEREYKPDVPIGDYVDNAGLIAQLLNDWHEQSGMAKDSKKTGSEGSTTSTNDD
jgi:hypothetical protein